VHCEKRSLNVDVAGDDITKVAAIFLCCVEGKSREFYAHVLIPVNTLAGQIYYMMHGMENAFSLAVAFTMGSVAYTSTPRLVF